MDCELMYLAYEWCPEVTTCGVIHLPRYSEPGTESHLSYFRPTLDLLSMAQPKSTPVFTAVRDTMRVYSSQTPDIELPELDLLTFLFGTQVFASH